ncbi:alpha beta hydrolase [Fusarium beomiforme]|uniref:Alpha beta hydrolase n=1 Tax=Fusarium beomiforme TaxID=44412 RepID=A0A9P5ASN2_9HYPO|nr:alpha beta hydrolase [Fusarium beomiforme]
MARETRGSVTKFELVGNQDSSYPLVIFFHGSGDSCESWASLADLLRPAYQVLLWDRQDPYIRTDKAISELLEFLDGRELPKQYVLIAHSYGGTFARLFLEARPHQIAGIVLAETGAEPTIDPQLEQRQYDKKILGNKPLVVIRGNTLKWKQLQYDQAIAAEQNLASPTLLMQKELLDATDKEDERLKKAQLQLSRNNRYVHIPDVSHDVIIEKPEAVREAVCWVMEHLQSGEEEEQVQEEQAQVHTAEESKTAAKKTIGDRLKRAKKISLRGSLFKMFKKSDS